MQNKSAEIVTPNIDVSSLPRNLRRDLRSDHAGETGAVFIYKGILKLSKDKDIISFSKRHLITEADHLRTIERLLPKKYHSKLINLWNNA